MVVAVAAVVAASATYKQHLNAICRTYTPAIHRLERDADRAEAAGDQHRWGRDVGSVVGIALLEGDKLLKVPVPVALKAEMAEPLRLLRAGVAAGHAVLNASNTTQDVFRALDRFDRAGTRVSRAFDAVGLRDCGSNQ